MRPESADAGSVDASGNKMNLEVEILLRIVRYCDRVSDDLFYFGNDEDVFISDDRFQRSVAFCIFQIGENVKSLRRGFPVKYGSTFWKGIAGMRDIIGHGYESFDIGSLWVTASEKVPELRDICNGLLKELNIDSV